MFQKLRSDSMGRFFMLIFFVVVLGNCSYKPEPIDYGKDACAACKMTIVDNRYAAELITQKGKVLKFDAIECLFNYKSTNLKDEEIHSEWVCDFSNPGNFINLRNAYFLHTEAFQSPMGLDVLCVPSEAKLKVIKSKYGGHIMNYNEVQALAIQSKIMMKMEEHH